MTSRPRRPPPARSSRFDALFTEHAGTDIPVAMLHALAFHESSFRPEEINPAGAWGLFQITRPALDDYNARHSASYTTADLLDPSLNTTIAAEHIRRILALYAQHPALQVDWQSRRFVELFVWGWNVGHNGVARVVAHMEAAGLSPERITVDTASQVAPQVSRNPNLSDPAHVAYAKAVTRTFFGDAVSGGDPSVASEGTGGGGSFGLATFLLGLGVLGLAVAVTPRGR
jgi:soluble lytic murein transglycosylase-like protein